jgi:hypothetical protein
LLIKKNIKACFNPKIKSFLTNIFKNVWNINALLVCIALLETLKYFLIGL